MASERPAGWYTDPGSGRLRWWDGETWSDVSQRHDSSGKVVAGRFASERNRAVETGSSGWGVFGVIVIFAVIAIVVLAASIGA